MKKPELTDKHNRFEAFVGRWKGPETLSETPLTPDGKADGCLFFRTILQGFFMTVDWVEKFHGRTQMEAHGVIGWDAKQKSYTLHWFDNFGSPPLTPGKGTWNGHALVFEHDMPTHQGRETLTLDDGKLAFKLEMTFEGQWKTVVDGTYQRDMAL
ncbi:MAG: DUF1579 domain-containing protein [Myxococcaceae bacterium]|nr:DUF1579 domain-containing protein [Myxococcaceae bacterium]